jgi:hypothetical protein
MAGILVAYGGLLAGLGFVLHQTAPKSGNVTFMAEFAGGGLCLLWGIAALAGLKGRVGAVLTTIALALILVSQTVPAWTDAAGEGRSFTGRLLVTALLLLTIGMLMYLLHGERPPGFYQKGGQQGGDGGSSRNEGQPRDRR